MGKKEKSLFKRHPILTFVYGVFGFFFLLFMIGVLLTILTPDTPDISNYNSGSSSNSNQMSSSSSLSVGDEGKLYSGAGIVSVAVTKDALGDLTDASVAGDSVGYQNVFLEGRAFLVDDNTKVLIIDSGFISTKVRILEGDHSGEDGWVPYEWIR